MFAYLCKYPVRRKHPAFSVVAIHPYEIAVETALGKVLLPDMYLQVHTGLVYVGLSLKVFPVTVGFACTLELGIDERNGHVKKNVQVRHRDAVFIVLGAENPTAQILYFLFRMQFRTLECDIGIDISVKDDARALGKPLPDERSGIAPVLSEQKRHQLGMNLIQASEITTKELAYQFSINRGGISRKMEIFDLFPERFQIGCHHFQLCGFSGTVKSFKYNQHNFLNLHKNHKYNENMCLSDTKLMGIINLNDDSFYAGSRAAGVDGFRRKADALLLAGASIIDIGAISSRPGASPVSAQEEWDRLEPVICEIARNYRGVSFSIDTFRPSIVLMAYQEMGRFIVNDISAGEWDRAMLPVVGRLGLRYIAMHHQGTFETMHDEYHYDDVVKTVCQYFEEFAQRAEEAGIENWILDPGFGFSKSVEDNRLLLDNLSKFKLFRKPILVGISRKSFIYKPLGLTPEECEAQTRELEKKAAESGASIIRTHLS